MRELTAAEVFNIFFAGVSYFRERADRQLFSLRAQLKEQYRAVQSAQAMERRAEHFKKRFVSYSEYIPRETACDVYAFATFAYTQSSTKSACPSTRPGSPSPTSTARVRSGTCQRTTKS